MTIKAKIIDFTLLSIMLVELVYVPYQLFVVFRPEGGSVGALGAMARTIPFELMVTRRLYAFEFYFDLIALVLYLAYRQKILEQFNRK